MSETVTLEATARKGVGKGAARATRRAGLVPAVIYGGKEPPVTIAIKDNVLLKTLRSGGFYTTAFDIMVDGEAHRAIPKEIQKNKLNGLPTHVDFYRLAKGARIVVNVPVHFTNEEGCVGLNAGGVLNMVRHEVELEVPNDAIPDHLELDLAPFDVGDAIKISAFTLPKGASVVIDDRDFTIATIAAPSALRSEGEEDEVEETEVIEQNDETVMGEDAKE